MSQYQTTLLLFLVISVTVEGKVKTIAVEDLSNITLQPAGKGYQMTMQIQHHTVKLQPKFQSGRTWIKEATCRVCRGAEQECTYPCFTGKDAALISCDSAMCQKLGDYSDEAGGVEGIDTEMFAKIGKDIVLFPVVLAMKLESAIEQYNGCFNIFDQESSFSHGLFFKGPKGALQLANYQQLDTHSLFQKVKVKEVTNVTTSADELRPSQLKVISLLVRQKQTLHSVEIDTNSVELQLSLSIQGVALPAPILTQVHEFVLNTYFEGKACRFLPGRLKCREKIEMDQVFESIIDIKSQTFTLSLPFQLLFSGCSLKECTCLLEKHEFGERITLGLALWQIYSLEYDIPEHKMAWMRKDNPWNDLYDPSLVNPEKIGYFHAILLLLYHVVKEIIILIFWLALLSLLINALIHWKKILKWFRDLLVKRKAMRVAQQQSEADDQDYSMQAVRRIQKLPSALEDSETL